MKLSKAKETIRAGMIPFIIEDGKIKMMFMKPSDSKFGGSDWQIAKGEIDSGESPVQTAYREANEELGLKKSNVENLFSIGTFWSGKFHVFIVKVKDKKAFGKPHFETKATAWLNWGEWYSKGRRDQTKIVSAAYKIMKASL